MWLQYLETPLIDISGTEKPILSAMGNWAVEDPFNTVSPFNGFDGCNIWISVDGGKSFEVAIPTTPSYDCLNFWSFSDYLYGWNLGDLIPGWAGQGYGWIPIEVDLTSFISDSLIIRFALASDPYVSAEIDPSLYGFLIDDILVSDGEMVLFEDHGDDEHNMNPYGIGGIYWLGALNYSSIVNPGELQNFGLIIQTRELTSGKYSGIVRFTSTDPPAYSIDVPCNLTVTLPDHDIAVEAVWFPCEKIPLFLNMRARVQIRNCGLSEETDFFVICNMSDTSQVIYRDTIMISRLSAGQTDTVNLNPIMVSAMGPLFTSVSLLDISTNDYNSFNNYTMEFTKTTNILGDFDSDNDLWNMTGGWALADNIFHSGTKSVNTNGGSSTYGNNMDAILTPTSCINIPEAENIVVRYWLRYWTEEDRDICYFEASTDSLNWNKLDSISGTGPRNWIQKEVNLSDLVKNDETKIWIRFHFISDSVNTANGVFIDDIDIYSIATTLTASTERPPGIWELKQNYPNPFNPVTTIEFLVAQPEFVRLKIYNVKGQMVKCPINKILDAGTHRYQFDGRGLASGIYYYSIMAGDYRAVRKMVLLK
jgi:hypothetical protein